MAESLVPAQQHGLSNAVTGIRYLFYFLFICMFLVMEHFVSQLRYMQEKLKAQPKEKTEKSLNDMNWRKHE